MPINIIKKYIKIISSQLDEIFRRGIINKETCEKAVEEYLKNKECFGQNNLLGVIQTSYKLEIQTVNSVSRIKERNRYTFNYERCINPQSSNKLNEYDIIYTNSNEKSLKTFDPSKIYIMFHEANIPDQNYSYIIKEFTIYIYISESYLDLVDVKDINVQVV